MTLFRRLRLLAGALIFSSSAAAPLRAANFTVVNLDDSGAGSLRDAIASAEASAGPDTIVFSGAGASGTITPASPLPAITQDLLIQGPGAANLTINGNNGEIFMVNGGASVTLRDATLSGGAAWGLAGGSGTGGGGGGGGGGFGGALFINDGAVAVEGVDFDSCTAGGGAGGDATTGGTLTTGGNGGDGSHSLGGGAAGGSFSGDPGGFGGGGAGGGSDCGGSFGFAGGAGGFGGGTGGTGGADSQGGRGGSGFGGALFVRTGSITLRFCNFTNNSALGGAGGFGAGAGLNGEEGATEGSSIYLDSGTSGAGLQVNFSGGSGGSDVFGTLAPLSSDTDLAVTADNSDTQLDPGEAVSYTVTLTNNGSAYLRGATISDNAPADLINVSWTSSASGGAVSGGGSGPVAGFLSDTVSLPAGASITYVVSGTVDPGASPGGLTYTATSAPPAGVTDTDNTDDSATDADGLTPVGVSGAEVE